VPGGTRPLPWGVVNERYAAYARALRFHVDATRPRAPEEKGKVERRIRAHQRGFDPRKSMSPPTTGSACR
jgi:hypothetical protein